MIDVEVEGVDRLRRILARMPQAAGRAVASGLRVEAEDIMAASKRLVPRDLMTLHRSGQVMNPKIRGGVIEIELGYGGDASAYALAVHEHPSEHSPPSWRGVDINWSKPGTGPKFLEQAVTAAVPGMGRRLGRHIKRGLR